VLGDSELLVAVHKVAVHMRVVLGLRRVPAHHVGEEVHHIVAVGRTVVAAEPHIGQEGELHIGQEEVDRKLAGEAAHIAEVVVARIAGEVAVRNLAVELGIHIAGVVHHIAEEEVVHKLAAGAAHRTVEEEGPHKVPVHKVVAANLMECQ